jgi:demethylmenaquinone methyltransferase/2-methoxy-6-polyprenyl-1,4-benzoquinol methylase
MNPERKTPQRHRPAEIREMFNAIAPTYDLLNHLLSFGLDIRWRKKAVRLLEPKTNGMFLDIACGSGDVSFELLELRPKEVVAVDFAEEMLRVFQRKCAGIAPGAPISIVAGDALALPFEENIFDGTIVAFGIRNFADRLRSLREMLRVIKPGGRSIILELSKPSMPVVRSLYSLYSQVGLPLFGKVISRHNNAYRYLPTSVAHFPDQTEFVNLMTLAGFAEVTATPLTLGTATIYVGIKKEA